MNGQRSITSTRFDELGLEVPFAESFASDERYAAETPGLGELGESPFANMDPSGWTDQALEEGYAGEWFVQEASGAGAAEHIAPNGAGASGGTYAEASQGANPAVRGGRFLDILTGPTLRRGDSGPQVARFQEALAELGAKITIDGRFGPNTEKAVRAFQSRFRATPDVATGLRASAFPPTFALTPDGVVGPLTRRALVAALGVGPLPPSPNPAPAPAPPPSPVQAGSGELMIQEHPLLRSHRGTRPDLILRWSGIGAADVVDVVVHFHGHDGKKADMRIDLQKAPFSGLDFADPTAPGSTGRRRPTLAMLPRGNFTGSGRQGIGFDFKDLLQPGTVEKLVNDGLLRLGQKLGRTFRRGRLIVTAHSGGGAALDGVLAQVDPDELHIFDALYAGSGTKLVDWAKGRIAREIASPTPLPPALRILYIAETGTQPQSEAVARALCVLLRDPAVTRSRPCFRVDRTTVGHGLMPRVFGWRLLADAAADLPKTSAYKCPCAACEAAQESEAASYGQEAASDREEALQPTDGMGFSDRQAIDEADEALQAAEDDELEALHWLDVEAPGIDESEAIDEAWGGAQEWRAAEATWTEDAAELADASELDEAERWRDVDTWVPEPDWRDFSSEVLDRPDPEFLEAECLTSRSAKDGVGEGPAPRAKHGVFFSEDKEDSKPFSRLDTLMNLLDGEAGAGTGLSDRLKGVAELVLGPTLRRGDAGPAVAALQRGLAAAGIDVAVDGKFGRNTERAVYDFQVRSKLASKDGVAGPRTKAALAAALAGADPHVPPAPSPVPPAPVPQPAGPTFYRMDQLTWGGASAEELDFMRRVYRAQVLNASKSRRFVADLPDAALEPAEADVRLRTPAGQSCQRMFAAARAALGAQKREGRVSARGVSAISASSGYRSASNQFGIWQSNFPKFYRETAADRARFPGGPTGEAAVAFTARYIGARLAAPGYSMHNDGLAVDLTTVESGGRLAANTASTSIAGWRTSWLWSWMSANAAGFGFYQNTSIDEPWHWEYRAGNPIPAKESPDSEFLRSGFLRSEADERFAAAPHDTFDASRSFLETEVGSAADFADRLKGLGEFIAGPTLRRGDSGTTVVTLQQSLVALGGPDLVVDGRFGPNTERAVIAFQSRSSLEADGVVGPRTKIAIAAALSAVPLPIPPPTPTPPIPRSRTYTNNPNEVEAKRTPPTSAEVVGMVLAAWPELTQAGARTLAAQFMAETGNGRSCYNWNLGNVKSSPDQRHMYLRDVPECLSQMESFAEVARAAGLARIATEEEKKGRRWKCSKVTVVFSPPDRQCRFRAYSSLSEGAQRWVDHHRRIAAKDTGYLKSLNAGDVPAVAHALKAAKYYTADEADYARLMTAKKAEIYRELGPMP